jgi:DNA mismatch repair protein MutL
LARIRLLDPETQNQIAAGEVVERPASVVKELVENALDAFATKVEVDIQEGGLALIRVTDNGSGMDEEDARLCMLRHATSKLAQLSDLEQIGSFGFRGEALPSIASVSRFRLVTRTREGSALAFAYDEELPIGPEPASAPQGTEITVRDLFYNVPARRKFLKSVATEQTHVTDAIFLAALSRHDVAFTLRRDGRTILDYVAEAERFDRVAACMDRAKLTAYACVRGPLQIEAFLSPPSVTRATASALHLFVRGRPIRDRALVRAVAQAYGQLIPAGRYPEGAVYLELDGALVDVNVHPQKSEVRFADPRALFDAVHRGLGAEIQARFGAPGKSADAAAFGPPVSGPAWPARERQAEASEARTTAIYADQILAPQVPKPAASNGYVRSVSEAPALSLHDEGLAKGPHKAEAALFEGIRFYGKLKIAGEVFGDQLITEAKDALYIIDTHALIERWAVHMLYAQTATAPKLAHTEVTPALVRAWPLLGPAARMLGIEAEPSGKAALALEAVPQVAAAVAPGDVLAALSRAWEAVAPNTSKGDLRATQAGPLAESLRAGFYAELACQVATQILTSDARRTRVEVALAQMDAVNFARPCRHGKPILMRVGHDELLRKRGRP